MPTDRCFQTWPGRVLRQLVIGTVIFVVFFLFLFLFFFFFFFVCCLVQLRVDAGLQRRVAGRGTWIGERPGGGARGEEQPEPRPAGSGGASLSWSEPDHREGGDLVGGARGQRHAGLVEEVELEALRPRRAGPRRRGSAPRRCSGRACSRAPGCAPTCPRRLVYLGAHLAVDRPGTGARSVPFDVRGDRVDAVTRGDQRRVRAEGLEECVGVEVDRVERHRDDGVVRHRDASRRDDPHTHGRLGRNGDETRHVDGGLSRLAGRSREDAPLLVRAQHRERRTRPPLQGPTARGTPPGTCVESFSSLYLVPTPHGCQSTWPSSRGTGNRS